MTAVRVEEAASHRIDENCRDARARRGEAQAEVCITGLFDAFPRIANREVLSRPIPAEFGVEGFLLSSDIWPLCPVPTKGNARQRQAFPTVLDNLNSTSKER